MYGSDKTPLKLGKLEIPCYVLEDGTAVLSARGMQSVLSFDKSHGSKMGAFLDKIIKDGLINNELATALILI